MSNQSLRGAIWRRSLLMGTTPPAVREIPTKRPVREVKPKRDLARERLDDKLRIYLGEEDYKLLREILEKNGVL